MGWLARRHPVEGDFSRIKIHERFEGEVDMAATAEVQVIGDPALAVKRPAGTRRRELADIRPAKERALADRASKPRDEEVRPFARAGPNPVADGLQRMLQVDLFLPEMNMRQYFYISTALARFHCGSFLLCGRGTGRQPAPVYSQGIFTVLQYSSQLAPKVFDSAASSAGANILEPMYRMMPISAPSHVLNRKPSHGSTSRATLV